jgi:peptide deformylase
MSIRKIIFSNDPLLREPSRHVRRVDADTQDLIDDMIETMHHANGIGLAAVQVGVPERVIVVNPEVVRASRKTEEDIEGCLSVPGWVGEVERHRAVTVEGLDRSGNKVRIKAEGFLARVFQHEIDHCQGILYIDRIPDPEKIWQVEEGTEEEAEASQQVFT